MTVHTFTPDEVIAAARGAYDHWHYEHPTTAPWRDLLAEERFDWIAQQHAALDAITALRSGQEADDGHPANYHG